MIRNLFTLAALSLAADAAPFDIVLLMDTTKGMETMWQGVSSSIPYLTDYLRTVHPDSQLGIVGLGGADSTIGSCVQLSNSLLPVSRWHHHDADLGDSLTFGGTREDEEYYKALLNIAYGQENIKWSKNEDRDRLIIAITSEVPSSLTESEDVSIPAITIQEDIWSAWDTPCSLLPVPHPEVVKRGLLDKQIGLAVLRMESGSPYNGPIIHKDKCEGECSAFASKFVQIIDSYVESSHSSHEVSEIESSTALVLLDGLEPVLDTKLRGPQTGRVWDEDEEGSWWWVFPVPRVALVEPSSPAPLQPVQTIVAASTSDVRMRDGFDSDSDLPIWWLTIVVRANNTSVIQGAVNALESRSKAEDKSHVNRAIETEENAAADADGDRREGGEIAPTANPRDLPGYGTWWWTMNVRP